MMDCPSLQFNLITARQSLVLSSPTELLQELTKIKVHLISSGLCRAGKLSLSLSLSQESKSEVSDQE